MLQPSNVLITWYGLVKLSDFGLVRVEDVHQQLAASSTAACGGRHQHNLHDFTTVGSNSSLWMATEQFDSPKFSSYKADIQV